MSKTCNNNGHKHQLYSSNFPAFLAIHYSVFPLLHPLTKNINAKERWSFLQRIPRVFIVRELSNSKPELIPWAKYLRLVYFKISNKIFDFRELKSILSTQWFGLRKREKLSMSFSIEISQCGSSKGGRRLGRLTQRCCEHGWCCHSITIPAQSTARAAGAACWTCSLNANCLWHWLVCSLL